uniref:Ribonuclease inhibitor-like protein n=1 Tax=Macrostomum lignano TaxID=282301 RepID=A0A1I8GH96_9PLAT
NNAHLRSLILEDNELRCLGCQQLLPIRLINNAINLRGLTQLTDALIKTGSLKILDLSGNRFEEKCGLQLRRLLEENRSIEELHVGHNNFREKGTIAIAYGL